MQDAISQASSLDLWVLWLKLMASGISGTLLVMVTVVAWQTRRQGGRESTVARAFALANLFAALYIGADALVRLDVFTGELSKTLTSYRVALSAVVLAAAAYIRLYWAAEAPRGTRRRQGLALQAGAVAAAAAVWIDHPALIIASDRLTVHGMSAFADYGAGAGLFFGLIAGLFAAVFGAMRRSSLRASDRLGWRLNLLGFALLLLAGVHDALRELGVRLLPLGVLWLGLVAFQIGAFVLLALHYARLLRERQIQRRQVQHLSDALVRDTTSGLYSRGYLEGVLNGLASSSRGGLLFIDLDDFKAINDRHGHLCGDRTIQAVAELLRANLREDDVPCRWGGDEFLVYLPNTDLPGVRALAARLAEAGEWLLAEEVPELRIGLSMGYAALGGGDWRAALEQADRALYRAKRAGKNRLMIAEESAATASPAA